MFNFFKSKPKPKINHDHLYIMRYNNDEDTLSILLNKENIMKMNKPEILAILLYSPNEVYQGMVEKTMIEWYTEAAQRKGQSEIEYISKFYSEYAKVHFKYYSGRSSSSSTQHRTMVKANEVFNAKRI